MDLGLENHPTWTVLWTPLEQQASPVIVHSSVYYIYIYYTLRNFWQFCYMRVIHSCAAWWWASNASKAWNCNFNKIAFVGLNCNNFSSLLSLLSFLSPALLHLHFSPIAPFPLACLNSSSCWLSTAVTLTNSLCCTVYIMLQPFLPGSYSCSTALLWHVHNKLPINTASCARELQSPKAKNTLHDSGCVFAETFLSVSHYFVPSTHFPWSPRPN
jgi:hypothetical protein